MTETTLVRRQETVAVTGALRRLDATDMDSAVTIERLRLVTESVGGIADELKRLVEAGIVEAYHYEPRGEPPTSPCSYPGPEQFYEKRYYLAPTEQASARGGDQ